MKNSLPNHSFRSTQRSNRAPVLGMFLLGTAIALLFLVDRLSSGVISGVARTGAGGVRSAVAGAAEAVIGTGALATRATLQRENDELRREIALHAEEIAQAEYLRAENETLRSLAHLAETEDGRAARVLSSFQATPYGTFLIDAGENDGIHVGNIVLTPGGFLLGVVKSASWKSATVESIFAPAARVDVVVGDAAFVAEGRGGGNAFAQVPREAPIAIGMPVVAQIFQRNVGTVMHIEAASSSATADLSIRIPVNLDTLRFVYVVSE